MLVRSRPYFLWRSAATAGDRLGWYDKVFAAFCLGIMLPITFGLGMTTAVKGLIDGWKDNGGVFRC